MIALRDDIVEKSRQNEVFQLRAALEKSVKLQSHYAGLLNQYDGGKRLQFSSIEEWVDRLTFLEKGEQNRP